MNTIQNENKQEDLNMRVKRAYNEQRWSMSKVFRRGFQDIFLILDQKPHYWPQKDYTGPKYQIKNRKSTSDYRSVPALRSLLSSRSKSFDLTTAAVVPFSLHILFLKSRLHFLLQLHLYIFNKCNDTTTRLLNLGEAWIRRYRQIRFPSLLEKFF